MNLAELSIKRPTFITCIIILMLSVGLFALSKLGVDLFPDVAFPVVTVTVPYPGAGPAEIETLVTKPLEDEIGTLAGIKRLTSVNQEGIAQVITEFTLETDVKYAEQQIRDRVSSARRNLPIDIKEPVIRRLDPSDQPIIVLALKADMEQGKLYDLAYETIKPKLEQVKAVGLVEVVGGRKREILVELDRAKLKSREVSASQVAGRIGAAGENIPAGKVSQGAKETVYRTLGQFGKLKDIETTIVNFFGSDVPTVVSDVGRVVDTLEEEKTRTYISGSRSLFLTVYRQSGSNTIEVAEGVKKRITQINEDLKVMKNGGEITVVRDASKWITANVEDVKESIFIGITLAVIVVFFFLGSGRSTIITGLALPNSLIGAFILMMIAGFTINIMTLLALSLSVGLLIDDAIVVRENIFRHIEMGKSPVRAALEGTAEVRLAVIATTLAVIAVFGPVGFLSGVVGQFLKSFGITICFAMLISLWDALTIAPMLSAYFAGHLHEKSAPWYENSIGRVLKAFNRFQDGLENRYEKILKLSLRRPLTTLAVSVLVSFASCATIVGVPKTFLPTQDNGEFSVALDLPPGTSLEAMDELARKVDEAIRKNSEVLLTTVTVGGNEANVTDIYVGLTPFKTRSLNTSEVKAKIREQLKEFASANPKVKDFDGIGGGLRPFNLNLISTNQEELEKYSQLAFAKLKNHPALIDVDINYRPGKPEFQIIPDQRKMEMLGISSIGLGNELRAQVEGLRAAKFRENGVEYDVRVRLREEERALKDAYSSIFVPNINNQLVRLSDVAKPVETVGPAKITRQDRGRYIQIAADIAPGRGMGEAMSDINKMFATDIKLPPGMRYAFVGQAENFKELGESMLIAMGFGVLFIFMVLASLYESFVTPFTIMLALPLAMSGAFLGLFVGRESLNLFSMIGSIMLLGVATKNSILLVDYANQLMGEGMNRAEAMIKAGKTRLRPILMTTMALIAGTLPLALGLNEASRQRTSMGVAIIGGLISSTLLTLVVIPAAFEFIDRFRIWSKAKMSALVGANSADESTGKKASNGNGKSRSAEAHV